MRDFTSGKAGEIVGHTPYGYFIENGKAVINEVAAEQVRELFRAYLSGLSMEDAGKQSGVNRCHTSLGKMLTDVKYLGDAYYPAIIDRSKFDQAQAERQRRIEKLGRVREQKDTVQQFPKLQFHFSQINQVYDDPFKQAEYAYSLIESEEITDDK